VHFNGSQKDDSDIQRRVKCVDRTANKFRGTPFSAKLQKTNTLHRACLCMFWSKYTQCGSNRM